jgi:Ca2+:H+ antiporter
VSDLFFQLKSHAFLFEDEQIHDEEPATMEIRTAIVSLVAVTVVTSFVADILVGAIDEFAATFDLSKAFIGLILLPIVGNAAEHATSVVMAYKGALSFSLCPVSSTWSKMY